MNHRSIHTAFPATRDAFPHEPIASLPTPVTPLDVAKLPGGLASLHVKRDDQTASPFGGNKLRKLEFILGEARGEGRREIITFGFAGSNHCVATARAAKTLGIHTTSLLLPQKPTPYVAQNLVLGIEAGATLVHRETTRGLAVALAKAWLGGLMRHRVAPKIVPAGGSSLLGMIGYVNAGLELAEQITAGILPCPDMLYVALGSGGTSVGLQAGLALAGLDVEVVPVLVVERRYMSAEKLRRMQRALASFLSARGVVLPSGWEALTGRVRGEFFGPGYGESTAESRAATELVAREGGISLDAAYSSKAFAALVEDARAGTLRDRHVVFWHTYGGPEQAQSTSGVGGARMLDPDSL
ncbi:MAG: 1-aminocyclopropane-1-carboxylate deaminase/D-cysteine desulfhydrase, partial [Nannocystaceae bacterium]